jgi:hypothetical protein
VKKVRYETLKDCITAFLGNQPGVTIDTVGEWVTSKERMTMKEMIARHTEIGCWGWCENKEIIHLWVGEHADILNVINLIAHEVGHTMRPWHKDHLAEEDKACRYGDVARDALMLMLSD